MAAPRALLVWPAWQRVLHWALAASVLVALATYEGGSVHEASGYAALALALLRVLLGLAGPAAARFRSFVVGPRATLAYARAVLARAAPRPRNHNPLGAWMVLALLAVVAVAAGSGALYVTDRYWGIGWVIGLHAVCSWSLAVLVPLHIVGAIVTGHLERENLVAAMVHGRKRGGGAADAAPPR